MTTQRERPFVWLTWLSRLMTGERTCLWASWFRAHYEGYERLPIDFNEAVWKVRHTALLTDVATQLEQEGQIVTMQEQNRFRCERASGTVVVGVPDLIAMPRATVYECKTGQPRVSDQVQVMLVMYLLPLCRPEYETTRFDGCVAYRTSRVLIPAIAIDAEFAGSVERMLDILESHAPARRVPSATECGFCEITAHDCPDRLT